MMFKKLFMYGLIAGSALTLQAAEKPLNILFIFTDDHATQAIGAYGSRINKTPNIDRLATHGAVFSNSFCSNSICGPSRASILTGQHSHKNGFYSNESIEFDGSQTTFPKLLRKAGYQTALIGKWHLGSDPTGFDHWEILPNQGNYYNPNLYKEGENTDFQMWKWGKKYQGYATDIVTDLSIEWLEKRDKTKPFLLMSQHKAPHEPWDPPLKYLSKYDDVTIPEPATLFDDYANRSETLAANTTNIVNFMWSRSLHYTDPVDKRPPTALARMTPEQKDKWHAAYGPKNREMFAASLSPREMAKWRYQRYIKDYLRCIDSVDDNVGRILDYLEENGLMDNTVIIYSSDQGFYLGEHGWYDKRWMFEESLAMPLIVRWPGVTSPGSRINKLVQNIDYAPTFCEIAGITPPDDMQGRSLKPIINDSNARWRTSIYYHYYEYPNIHNVPPHEGIRTDRYKLINFYKNDGFNLFDLKNDPSELTDLSNTPEYCDILQQMKRRLADLRKQYDVPPLDATKVEPKLREPAYPLKHR
jgi:arylsulfatase A-like enzyme